MAKKITFEFTPDQYRALLDIVYAGNNLLTSTNEDNEEKYNEIESMVFSKVKEIGKENFAEYYNEYGGWLPTSEFEKDGVDERIEDYDKVVMWANLCHVLALRDVATTLRTANQDIVMDALLKRTDEYSEFFENHGVESLVVKGMKKIDTNSEIYRSYDVGEVESYGNMTEE